MTFSELLNQIDPDRKIILLTTATNGLDPHKDRLIGTAVMEFKSGINFQLLRKTDEQDLEKSYDYHKISTSLMRDFGMSDSQFLHYLNETIDNSFIFTYNPGFQFEFLSQLVDPDTLFLYDLTVIHKALEQGTQFAEEDCMTLQAFYAQCQRYNSIPVSQLLKKMSMSRQPGPGQLPMARMLDVLHRLFVLTSPLPVEVQ